MQKLLIAAALGAMVLTGCTTTKTATNAEIQAPKGDMHTKHGKKPPKHPHGEMSASYTCDSDANVLANYNPKADNVTLKITAPSLSLSSAEVEAKHVPSGSGMLFVNDVNPASKYEWHAKGDFAMLDVTTADGKVHTLRCESDHPMHKHDRNAPEAEGEM